MILMSEMLAENIHAQVRGKVSDADQRPIQGLIILNTRTQEHTHTNDNGYFSLMQAVAGDSLEFSYLGYVKQTMLLNLENMQSEVYIEMKESNFLLEQVNISEPVYRNLEKIDVKLNLIRNSQELLNNVAGLNIAQHAGGGKAEQIFLRGFDIDHGTDIAISVNDLLPVNMTSHAHGQGYADLHFIIPETVRNIHYEKGSYDASKGNLATAAYVDFELKDKIENNHLIFETGKYEYNRLLTMIKLKNDDHINAYIAGEYVGNDGYFDLPQDFKKLNLLFQSKYKLGDFSRIQLMGTFFSSKWNSSGQIPQRAVDSGLIGRFGFIDPDEGGETKRNNLMVEYHLSKRPNQKLKLSAYYSSYDFDLYSNFTFYLNDTINGDQIHQSERRNIYGIESSWVVQNTGIIWKLALGTRIDDINNLNLSHTASRTRVIEQKVFGDVGEQNLYAFFKMAWFISDWEFQLQSRADMFYGSYNDRLPGTEEKFEQSQFICSPKLNVYYNLNPQLQIYFKNGLGFHSNDVRLIRNNVNSDLLTRSFNSDFGIQLKAAKRALFHAAVWIIDMEDELVYVGDEAIVEPNGHTQLKGLEAGLRWQPFSWLNVDTEASYTLAKTIEESENQNRVPLAAKWASSGGISVTNLNSVSFGLRYRYLGDRPANQDYSITAKGFAIVDGFVNYKYRSIDFTIIGDNLLNSKWNEAQFASTSRLIGEKNPVEEIHFTPGGPFNFRVKIQLGF